MADPAPPADHEPQAPPDENDNKIPDAYEQNPAAFDLPPPEGQVPRPVITN
jgi:hypothetical protein